MSKINLICFKIVPTPNTISLSGSDMRFVNVINNFSNNINVYLYTSNKIYKYFKNYVNKLLPIYQPKEYIFSSKAELFIKSLLLVATNLLRIKNILLVNKVDVVYSTSDLIWEVFPSFFSKCVNRKIIWVQVIHHIYPDPKHRPGNKFINYSGFILQKISFIFICNRSDLIITLNKQAYSYFNKKAKNSIVVKSTNGIDLKTITQTKEPAKKKYDLVIFGRVNQTKGSREIIPLVKLIKTKYPSIKLVLVGDIPPEELNLLKSQIYQNNLTKNIQIKGFLNYVSAIQIIKESRIGVSLSHEEGWGITIAEYMAAKLPVVAYRLDNLLEVYKNHINYSVCFDLFSFSNCILSLLHNPKEILSQGKNNYNFVQRYNWKNVATYEEELLTRKVQSN